MSSPRQCRQSPLETQLPSRTSSRPRPLAPDHIEIPPPALLHSRAPSRHVESPQSGSLPELSLSSRRSSPDSLDSVLSGYDFEVIEASRSLPDLPQQSRRVEEAQIPTRPVLSRSGSLFFEDILDGNVSGRLREEAGGTRTVEEGSHVPGLSTFAKRSLAATPSDTPYYSRNAPTGDVFDGLFQLPQLSSTAAPKVPYFLAYPPARHSSVAVPTPVSPHPRGDYFQSFPLPPTLQAPPQSPLARTRIGGKGPIPFVVAPTPPPEAPLPHPPSFVSIFVDPATNTVPPLPTTPRRADFRTSSSLAHSRASPTKSRVPRLETPVERKSSLKKSMESMRRVFVGDWMRKDAPKTDADLPLSDLVARAVVVERQLIGTGVESDVEAWSNLRSRRNTSLGSKWSFGATGSQFVDVDREEGWSRIKDEGADRARRAAKREKREGVDRRSRDRRIGEAKSKTEAWLSGVPATSKSVSSWSRLLPRRSSAPEEPMGRESRRIWIIVLVLVGLAIAAGLAIYFTTRPKAGMSAGPSTIGGCTCENGGIASILDGVCACRCDTGWGGSYCSFNSTCTTTPRSGRLQLAQGLIDVATHANTVFSPSIDTSRLAVVLHNYLGLPSSISISQSDCTPQLSLVTLPNLPPSNFTNRLAFVSAAVLWTTAMSESNTSALLTFVSSLSFTALGDSPGSKPDSNYQIIQSGYAFDFSTMTVFLPSVSWISAASPVSSQIALVDPQSHAALDRMTGYASAASTQRSKALAHYWAELNVSSTSLESFKLALQNAPVVIPFDADNVTMASAGKQGGDGSFPPAISCEGGLGVGRVSFVNSVETNVFGLPSISTTSAPDATCLDRPLYGVLNILSLRLPFPPSSPHSSQGVIVSAINKDRMTVHAGETLVARSNLLDPTTPSSPILPERYGTLERFDHVVFEYLRLMTPALARAIIAFVLAGDPTPPSSTSDVYLLSQGFNTLPMIEVQLWGGLRRSNVDHVVSSLSTTSQSMFFGSSLGNDLRNWALGGNASIPIWWSLDALQREVVVDLSLSTSTSFGKIWLGVSNSSSPSPSTVWNQLVVAELVSPG